MAESDVFVRFGADIDPLKKGVNQASNKLDQFGTKAKDTAVNLGKIAGAAAVAGAAIGVKLVADSMQAIDAQAKLAKQLGTTSASVATLSRAADMSGISMKNIESGAKNLEVAMGEAASGTGVAVDTLKRLQLTANDLEGMTLDQKILTVNRAIKENIPATEQAAAAADLFGKRAGFAIAQLDPATLMEATREVEGFGLAISDFDASKIEAANDAMATIGLAIDGVVQAFTIELAPILGAIANQFKEASIESEGFEDTAVSVVNNVASAVGFVADAFHGWDVIIDGLVLSFDALAVGVSIAFTEIVEAIDGSINAAKGIVNEMIAGINNLPGIDIEQLVTGKGALAESLRATTDAAKAELERAGDELNQKILGPLPSEQIEQFIASLREKNALEAVVFAEKTEAEAAAKLEAANVAKEAAVLAASAEAEAVAEVARAAADKELKKAQEVADKKRAIEKALFDSRVAATGTMFGNLATLTATGSKRLFEIGKVAAASETVVSTFTGAQKAFTAMAGIPVVGPALGIAAAGAAIVAGGVRLQAINSQTLGGGGSGVTAGAGGGGAVSTPVTAAQQTQAEPTRTMRVETLDPSALVSGSMVNEIAAKLVEFQEDGGQLIA